MTHPKLSEEQEKRFNEQFNWFAPDFSLSQIRKRPYELADDLKSFLAQEIELAYDNGYAEGTKRIYNQLYSKK